ncbi:NUDIX domain-containing protein [Patescibacteria group bacterium]|nr:NUDIX domain-containing protein [Patescibacteria group bacterium]
MSSDQYCFIGLKAMIVKDGKILVLSDPQMGPDLPGGKIQEGETDLAKALKREVKEETGLVIFVGNPFFVWMFTIPTNINHRSAGKKIFSVAFVCTYISGDVKLNPEHDSFVWVDQTNYKQYVEGSNFKKAFDIYYGTNRCRD